MTTDHPTPESARLTADVIAFTRKADAWYVLMIQRRWNPFEGRWALPGGHVDTGETFLQAAERELTEETGLRVTDLRQLDIYDRPDRDPRGRYVTVAFFTVLPAMVKPTAGDDARVAAWVPLTWLHRKPDEIAFDHAAILADAVTELEDLTGGEVRS
ncbi:NUDIX hydrolase [Amycolatopsis sp. H20-H5]|uniref:NUDIX hydrolase n=1 Tax=Amycolatopsis sp. H20-H5 TaxID=3046309 RepID=UPI002DBB9DCB|nr:NUDIX hydrolase [Amycolatopsis sp. H20-H5]MEC3974601.1 NUDIX hydrolase [Amycolatopsis sp. H20-H5]